MKKPYDSTAVGIALMANVAQENYSYNILVLYLLWNDPDFKFEHAVVGDEGIRATYNYKQLCKRAGLKQP